MENELPPLRVDTEHFFNKWAEYTVKRLQEALNKHRKPAWTDALYNSIRTELVKANGDVDAVILKFLQYGRFLDMGVGRGVSIGQAGSGAFSAARNNDGTLKRYRRKPEKWYSKTYFAEVQKVKELYVKAFGNEIPFAIQEHLSARIELTA